MPNVVERYGFKTMHELMDAHVARENARANPRRMQGKARDKNGRFVSNVVHYPYGGFPGTYRKPGGWRARQAWKQSIEKKIDQIGTQIAREASHARPGCANITVQPAEAAALAYKILAALKGGQVSDAPRKRQRVRNTRATTGRPVRTANDSPLHQARSQLALDALTCAIALGRPVRLGVYTRQELTTIARQRTAKKHYTRDVRHLERKLKGH